jgi:alpha-pyrone synthase
MTNAIIAIGTAIPAYKRPQKDTADMIIASCQLSPVEKRLLKSVYKSTGIEFRHSVLSDYCKQTDEFDFFPNDPNANFPTTAARMKVYQENALSLALAAIRDAFLKAENIKLTDITHVITVSCTGMYAPGLDIEIVQQLALKTNTKRMAINFMGCYGAFNAIKAANDICSAHQNATVLVVSVEICTIHFQKKMNIDNIIANSIFADGAAAIIVQQKPQQQQSLSLESFHCDLLPQTEPAMAWQIADSGFDIVLSSYVPNIIQSGITAFTQALFQEYDLTMENIHYFAIHPGGIKILEACEKELNITKEDNRFSYDTLKKFGNMSSATVLFVLKAIWDQLTTDDHAKNIFSCAFGPGLTLESMLLRTNCV